MLARASSGFGTGARTGCLAFMAKKKKAARVPKRIAGVKIPKPVRRAARPLAEFLASDFGRGVAADALVALAIAFASTDAMRAAFKDAAKRARKSGGGLSELALYLGRAAVLPALVVLHGKLPGGAQRMHSAHDARAH